MRLRAFRHGGPKPSWTQAASWTQAEVAAAVGIQPAALSEIERGKRGVHLEVAVELCRFYGRSIEELVAGPLAVRPGADSMTPKS